jgi:hypothetical protein
MAWDFNFVVCWFRDAAGVDLQALKKLREIEPLDTPKSYKETKHFVFVNLYSQATDENVLPLGSRIKRFSVNKKTGGVSQVVKGEKSLVQKKVGHLKANSKLSIEW